MKFCKFCNSLLTSSICKNCGSNEYISSKESEVSMNLNSNNPKIVEKKAENTVSFICPKCNNTKAKYQILQTRALDESPTQFYTCTKCGYCKRDE
jgi:DNA-directed RNA polymerase subunit M/transcription elongation factor TFIIS